jgi:hypothetical protein
MKIYCLVLVVMSGALTLAASDSTGSIPAQAQSETRRNKSGEHSNDAPTPESAKPPASSVRAGKGRVQQRNAKANHVPLPARATKANRLKDPANSQAKSTTAVARTANKSGSSQSYVATKKASIQNKSATNVSAVQRQNMLPSSSSWFDNQRHRGSNPAVIGGLRTSKPSLTGAINGSSMSRKP